LNFEIFKERHVEDAAKLALYKYQKEANKVKALPHYDDSEFLCKLIFDMCNHDFGVAAFENSSLVGFLTCYAPLNNYFGTSNGVFSPIHAHAAVESNSAKIYSLLYQEAAKIWVEEDLLSHSIALYAHDDAAIQSFFCNGFGLRCVDAICPLEKTPFSDISGYSFGECEPADYQAISNFENMLVHHMRKPPMFMPRNPSYDEKKIAESVNKGSRFFITKYNDTPVGFLKIYDEGENFVCVSSDMKNICGAYLLPEHRSKGVFHNLLSYVNNILFDEGYRKLGVDYESFNPTANAFWPKYFTPYTYSVTRRIDERILNIR
jgi:hypothetical protein